MDCSPPGSSVHWIPQARTLECVAIYFLLRGSSHPRDQTYDQPLLLHCRQIFFFFTAPPRKAICINTYILKVSRCPTKKEGREKGKKLTFYVNNVHNVSSLPNKRLKLSSIQNLAIHWPGRLPNIPEDQRKMLKKVAWWDSLKERCRVILKFLWFLENGSILCS